jgi:hypothetical protein
MNLLKNDTTPKISNSLNNFHGLVATKAKNIISASMFKNRRLRF